MPPLQRPQQLFDHAGRRLAFDPARLALGQRAGVGVEDALAERQRFRPIQRQAVGPDQHAGEETDEVPGARRQHRFVEIVDVEIDEAVVALEAAEVFEVQVAAQPGARRFAERRLRREALVEQVAGGAEEDEGAGAHVAELERQPLGVAPGVERQNAANDIDHEESPVAAARAALKTAPTGRERQRKTPPERGR